MSVLPVLRVKSAINLSSSLLFVLYVEFINSSKSVLLDDSNMIDLYAKVTVLHFRSYLYILFIAKYLVKCLVYYIFVSLIDKFSHPKH